MKLLIEEADPRTRLDDAARLLASEHPSISGGAAAFTSWYYSYAAGGTSSWLLRTADDELMGLCSIQARPIRHGNVALRAGVIGNLVVARESRNGYGAIELLRAVQSQVRNGRFDVLVGRPNQKANVLTRWLGFRDITHWETWTLLRRSRPSLRRRFGWTGSVLSPAVDAYAAVRRQVRRRSRAAVRFRRLDSAECARLCSDDWGCPPDQFVSDQDSAFLQWRYLDSPIHEYQVWGIEAGGSDELCGFLVLTLDDGKLHVWDVRVDACCCSIGDAITGFCESGVVDADRSQVKTPSGSRLSDALSRAGFMRFSGSRPESRDNMVGYWRDDHPLAGGFAQAKNWSILIGFEDV